MEEVHREAEEVARRPAGLALRLLGGWAVALAAACAATGEKDPWPAGRPPEAEVVGWLGDQPVTYGDVARFLRTKEPEGFARGLEGLVIERVTLLEAERLGVTVPKALVAREGARRMQEWQAGVKAAAREQTGEEIDPALWLQRVAGASLSDLRGWIDHHTEVELLQDRLLRYEALTSPRVEVSLLVVEEEARARELLDEALKGGDFGMLARRSSIHPSAPENGRLPYPLLPPDIPDPAVRDALFRAAAGSIVGPFAARGREKTYYEVYRIEIAEKPRKGSYAELGREVARDLEIRPVHVGEYERWRTRVLLRHGFLAAAGSSDDPPS